MLRRQRKRESLHLTVSRANKKRRKETGHSTLKWSLWWCAALQGLRQEKTQVDSQAIASPPLLNCFEKQIFTATINWDAGMLHGHGMRFRTAAQKPQKFPFWSFGLAVLNTSLACWCTAIGWGLLFFTLLNCSQVLVNVWRQLEKLRVDIWATLKSNREKMKGNIEKICVINVENIPYPSWKGGTGDNQLRVPPPYWGISLKEIFYCISLIQIM